MAKVLCLALLAAVLAGASAGKVTPMQKVLTLLKDLKNEVLTEGKQEAKTYDTFACFCRDKTMTLSKQITTDQDRIDQDSSRLQSYRAQWGHLVHKSLPGDKDKKERTAKELTDTEAECEKAQADYESSSADLTKALEGLGGAIKTLEDAAPSGSISAANLLSVRSVVKKNLELAQAMQILDHSDAAFTQLGELGSFVQVDSDSMVDPQDPEYKSHNQDIISILKKLQGDFAAQKNDLDTEWGKTNTNCNREKDLLTRLIGRYDGQIRQLEKNIAHSKRQAGNTRGDLVDLQSSLRDNKVYLEDLTKMCEDRAKDWDQRSAARGEEVKAMDKALTILMDDAVGVEDVNQRASLLQRPSIGSVSLSSPKEAAEAADASDAVPASGSAPSFLQHQRKMGGRSSMFRMARRTTVALASEQGASAEAAVATAQEARRAQALSTLQEASGRLQSGALAAVAVQVASDPFAKVKELISQLIQRLVAEASDEASKKGFCDTKLATARQERDTRMNEVNQLVAQVNSLFVKEDLLKVTIKELKESIKQLGEDLNSAEGIRKVEKAENTLSISKAKQGMEAVASAIDVLKVFYKNAAKESFAQTNSQQHRASLVDEDTGGPGFEGSYKGKQAGADGILGILEVIKSDFERTLKVTKTAEADAQAKFVIFDRGCKSDKAGKSTTLVRSEEDLDTTTRTKATKLDDLKTNMNLVDSALKQLQQLKPQCIDSGMSHDDRVAKREAEIAALKKSLCMLDENNVEPGC